MKMAMTHYATDIVFLIDATASMQPGFDDLKQAIVRFLESLEDPENTSRFLGPNFGPLLVDWRAAIYAYRDSKADGVKCFESRSFVRGVAAVKQQLAELRAEGGGTGPTDLVNALVRVSALDQIPREQEDEDSGKWRYRTKAIRQVFVLTDKACHMPYSISLEDLNSAIVDAGLRLWLFVPSGLSCYDDLNCIDKSEVLCYSTPFDENAIVPLTACFSDDCWRTYFFRNCRHDRDIQIGAPIDDPDYVAPFSTHHKSPHKKNTPAMSNENTPHKVKGVADIIFLVDATGSMQPGIDNLKNNIEHFFDLLENPSGPNGQLPVKDWRAAVYAYRDYAADGPKWFEPRPFVRGAAAVKAQLAEIKADGGGDEPEDLVDALLKIADMDQTPKHAQMEDPGKWRYRSEAARVVIVMTDASFHMPPPTQPAATIEDLNNKVCEAGLRLSLFVPSGFSCYDELSEIDKCEDLRYPVAAGENPAKALATFTGDETNFNETLKQLAKSVSASSGEIAQLP